MGVLGSLALPHRAFAGNVWVKLFMKPDDAVFMVFAVATFTLLVLGSSVFVTLRRERQGGPVVIRSAILSHDRPDTDGATRCRKCRYLLQGLPEPRCPECGEPFDPAAPPRPQFRPRWSVALTSALLGSVLLLGSIVLSLTLIDDQSLPFPQWFHTPVTHIGRPELSVGCLVLPAVFSSCLGVAFGIVLSVLATATEKRLTWREVVLASWLILLPFGWLALMVLCMDSHWAFETVEVFCMITVCAVAPFTLTQLAVIRVMAPRLA